MDGIHIVAFAEEEDPGLFSLVPCLSSLNIISNHRGNKQYHYINQTTIHILPGIDFF